MRSWPAWEWTATRRMASSCGHRCAGPMSATIDLRPEEKHLKLIGQSADARGAAGPAEERRAHGLGTDRPCQERIHRREVPRGGVPVPLGPWTCLLYTSDA